MNVRSRASSSYSSWAPSRRPRALLRHKHHEKAVKKFWYFRKERKGEERIEEGRREGEREEKEGGR